MQDAPRNLGRSTSILSYDGCAHTLTCAAGSWRVRMELEQLGAGEIVGVGLVWTTTHDADAEVIVSGRIDVHGVATVTLSPVMPCRRAPITLVLRLAPRGDGQDPIVSEVLEVRGLPA